MNIKYIKDNRRDYMDLLLIADEQEDMIEKYLDRGDMFILHDNQLIGACIVTKENENEYELKNIAIYNEFHGKGYGQKLIEYVFDYYKDKGKVMYVGTGEVEWILNFYKKCGFEESHRLENFFVDNYNHTIIDSGVELIDMIYLKKEL